MVARVLERTEATLRARGVINKEVAQSVLLYGIKIWVVTGDMLKVLEGLHHQAAWQTTGMTTKCGAGEEWDHPSE